MVTEAREAGTTPRAWMSQIIVTGLRLAGPAKGRAGCMRSFKMGGSHRNQIISFKSMCDNLTCKKDNYFFFLNNNA